MPTPLTLRELRQVTNHLPEDYKLCVRDLDCTTDEWSDSDVVLLGITDGGCVIFLSEVHAMLP